MKEPIDAGDTTVIVRAVDDVVAVLSVGCDAMNEQRYGGAHSSKTRAWSLPKAFDRTEM